MVTIQTEAVKQAMVLLGHATNQDVQSHIRQFHPNISPTTVHGITTRLVQAGELGYAPSNGKTVVLDANPKPHNHFVCKGCGGLKDIELQKSVFDSIQEQLGKNIVENGLVIYGICVDCTTKPRQNEETELKNTNGTQYISLIK